MFLIKGNVQIPESLTEVINSIPTDKSQSIQQSDFIAKFSKKIDPVLLCTFFGLYKSQELPPSDNKEIRFFSKVHDFNVDISNSADLLNHFLFCLWIKNNGPPNTCDDALKYRQKLYSFIERLLDPEYYRAVVIPYYLSKADEASAGTSSFIHRLASSSNVGLELLDYSPEFLAQEFSIAQKDFLDNVISRALEGGLSKEEKISLKTLLERDEDQCFELKSTLRFDIKASNHGHRKPSKTVEKEVLETICAFMNTDGGMLVIGVRDDKTVFGLANDFEFLPLKKDRDGFEVFLRKRVSEVVEPDVPGLLKLNFVQDEDKEICLVEVTKSKEPMFLKEKVNGKVVPEFYIRDGNQTRQLMGSDMVNYIKSHWSKSPIA